MIQLPHGCSCSEIKVQPSNWNTKEASTKKDWFIYYRFYDPVHRGEYPKGKYVQVKGFNDLKDVQDRRASVITSLKIILDQLTIYGFNPITGIRIPEHQFETELDPQTPMAKALDIAYKKLEGEDATLKDIKSVVKGVTAAAVKLNYDQMPIGQVTLKYYKSIFDLLRKPPTRHNIYRAYMMKIYKELLQMEAVQYNYPRDLQKRQILKKERVMPSLDDRKTINEMIKAKHYNLWRAIHVFYHSGARETELSRLQVKDVDLINQTVKYTVLKGQKREVRRPIQDKALHLWKELIEGQPQDYYIFSAGLVPGEKKIRPEQFSRYWRRHVRNPKTGLGIDISLYSLKHLNTTETMDELTKSNVAEPEKAVMDLTAHTSPAMIVKIYDTKNNERKMDKIKSVKNGF